ncbi:MAG: hypothetical protein HZA04_00175 [Nitrospinae bacterium]|nr:hypothetical protein [Nitrospinota bacterium]
MGTIFRPVLALLAAAWLAVAAHPACAADILFSGQDDILRGLDASYRLRFSEARSIFSKLTADHPASPAGLFYTAAIDSGMTESDARWRLMANLYVSSPLAKRDVRKPEELTRNLNIVIERCKTILRKNPDDFEALFYMAGSYAFLARMEGYRSNWLSAMYNGKKATGYFDELYTRYPDRGDALIGPAVYKYHVGRLPKPMQWLVWFLGLSGSREEGLRLAERAHERAILSKVEAADFLARTYWQYESDYSRALQWAEVLDREMPQAPLAGFVRLVTYHNLGDIEKEESAAKTLLPLLEGIEPEAKADWEPLMFFAIGTVAERKGETAVARGWYAKSLAVTKSDPRLRAEVTLRMKNLPTQAARK